LERKNRNMGEQALFASGHTGLAGYSVQGGQQSISMK
jgi:hypothetical protein